MSGPPGAKPPGGARQVAWFVAFYALSLVAFTALVYALRYVVKG